jgi:hypothetical protein
MSQVVPELVYRGVIKAALTWMKQNLNRVEDLMSGYDDEDVRNVRTMLGSRDVQVVQGFPRANTSYPCICIVLMQEVEETFIGDEIGVAPISDSGGGVVQGKLWNATHLLLCCSDNADLTVVLYQLLKLMMLRYNDEMQRVLHEITYEGGDLQPDNQYIPDHIYTRGLSIRAGFWQHMVQEAQQTINRISVHVVPETTAPWGEGEENAPLYGNGISTPEINIVSLAKVAGQLQVTITGNASSTADLYTVDYILYVDNSGTLIQDDAGTLSPPTPWSVTLNFTSGTKYIFSIMVTDVNGNKATDTLEYLLTT